jgi:NADPH2:quinone reductase
VSGPYRIVLRRTGGPEVLEVEPIDLPRPGPGEILIRQEAVGLNFIDVYHRTGLYPLPLPTGIGAEGAGLVEAVGEGVEELRPGDRVVYVSRAIGAYASHRSIAADAAVKLPDGIDSELAAATMLKGCTAESLIERCARIEAGETVLVHAAAGGVGLILVQWLKAIGATVIAHAGSPAKAQLAQASGADQALCCPLEGLAAEVRALTAGRGVDVVFDGVGAASWAASLASVARRGLIVSYGNASGPVPPLTVADLVAAGSIFLTRPAMFDYVATRPELERSTARLFEMIAGGAVKVEIGARFALREAADAHRAIEARSTTGSTVLIP